LQQNRLCFQRLDFCRFHEQTQQLRRLEDKKRLLEFSGYFEKAQTELLKLPDTLENGTWPVFSIPGTDKNALFSKWLWQSLYRKFPLILTVKMS
jgi:hypothetical protein